MKILKRNILYIYTDGSSLPKPRRGGIGIRYIILDDQEQECIIDLVCEGFEGATNNQMELLAVIEGLRNITLQDFALKYNNIEIRTDSRYVVDNKNNAIYNWSKNGWLNKYNKPVENSDLWKSFIKVLLKINKKVELIWVKGHEKDIHNKAVDKLAKESARGLLNEPINIIKLRKKKSKESTKVGSVEMEGQRISVHVINEQYLKLQKLSKYRYEIISKGNKNQGKVDFIYSDLHHLKAGHNYYVVFNKDSKNPRILKLIKELD